jgi:putative tryptophan/tyrosine transport system substrate-binding protein
MKREVSVAKKPYPLAGVFATVAVVGIFMLGISISAGGCREKPKVYRIGILSGLDFFSKTAAGFKEKMADFGYIEGRNIIYDCQRSNFDIQQYGKILNKFVKDKVDIILAFPTEASIEAKAVAQGTGVPVLFADAIVEETGLINTMTEPGTDITGVRWPGPDLAVKILEIMKDIAPHAKKILLPFQKGYPTIAGQLRALQSSASMMGVTLIEAPATDLNELRSILDSMKTAIDAIIAIPEPLSGTPEGFQAMCAFARKRALPIGGPLKFTEECEPLFGVNVDHSAVGKQAAILAQKILNGVPAGALRVVSAEIYIQINYKKIKKMGLRADEGLMSRANEVIR